MTAPFMSVPEAARRWGMSQYAIRKAIQDGFMPWTPEGDRPLVKVTDDDLEEYRRRRRVAAAPAALITTRRKTRKKVR